VVYEGEIVGSYLADVIVEDTVVLELKAARDIDEVYEAQLLSYMKATGLRKGLLVNFGSPRLGIRRLVL
jgi:GxxExxY protein